MPRPSLEFPELVDLLRAEHSKLTAQISSLIEENASLRWELKGGDCVHVSSGTNGDNGSNGNGNGTAGSHGMLGASYTNGWHGAGRDGHAVRPCTVQLVPLKGASDATIGQIKCFPQQETAATSKEGQVDIHRSGAPKAPAAPSIKRLPAPGLQVDCLVGKGNFKASTLPPAYTSDEEPPRLTRGGSVDLRSIKASRCESERSVDFESTSGEGSEEGNGRRHSVFGAMGMQREGTAYATEMIHSPSSPGLRSPWQTTGTDAEGRSICSCINHTMDLVIAAPAATMHKYRHFKWSRLIINPERSTCLEYWDMVTIVSLAFVALVAPVQVAMFDPRFDFLFVLNCIVDIVFLIDLALQFFLMYPKKTNYGYALEGDHKLIVKHYMKTWFIIDFISIIPFDLVGLLSESDEMKKLKAVKVVRLLRLLKLVRVLKASRLFRRFEVRMSITYGTFALGKFFCILLLITHWLANLWALTLVLVEEADGVPRWIDDFAELDQTLNVKTKDSPIKLYMTCLYFTSYTITSVGYGDIGPKNIVETVVCTCMIVISGISWAVVLGQVCGTISNLNADEQAFRSIMDELNIMMSDRVMPGDMRRRLRSFFLSNKLAQRRARHQRVIKAMSPGLQGEVVMELNRVWLTKVTFLSSLLQEAEISNFGSYFYSFVVDVSVKMETAFHAQSEVFGLVQALYILSRGLVSRHGRLHSAGAVWGQDFVLSDQKLLEPSQCLALTYVEAMFLKREDFFELVELHKEECPGLKRKVRRFCCWLAFQRAFIREAKKRLRRQARKQARKRERDNLEAECVMGTPSQSPREDNEKDDTLSKGVYRFADDASEAWETDKWDATSVTPSAT